MDIDEIALMGARALGENFALKRIVASLLARLASEHEDPEAYIMTLTAPLQEAFEEADDELSRALFSAAQDAAISIENQALDVLQR